MIRLALRAAAIAIAVAGIVDPVLSLERPVRTPLSIVISEQSRRVAFQPDEGLRTAADRLKTLLDADFRVSVTAHDAISRAAACPAIGGCILVSDGTLPARISEGAAVIGAARLDLAGPVPIVGLRGPREAYLNAASTIGVTLDAAGAAGTTRLQVFDGGVLVGQTEQALTRDTRAVTVAVEWVPVSAGPRRLRVLASLRDGDRVFSQHEAETAVEVHEGPLRVVMHEPEASWAGTFVRRAIEADARFRIDGRVQVAPAVSVTRGSGGSLQQSQLDTVRVVVATAIDRLTASDVERLERFVRVRGGSVVLLPDREIAGPVARLFPPVARMLHEQDPQPVGALRARDLMTFTASTGVTVLASAGDRPVVVARALGRGRVVVSGALDAWRYRDGGGFARFWTGLLADAASATGPAVRIDLGRTLLEPGEETSVRVEWRAADEVPMTLSADAAVDCAGRRQPIRLWPDARRGVFTGALEAPRAGTCVVTASIGTPPHQATTALVVTDNVRRPMTPSSVFQRAIEARGGSVVNAGEEAALAARARTVLEPRREPQPTRPMHSPWWILPLAACLGAEWTLRRRAGLR